MCINSSVYTCAFAYTCVYVCVHLCAYMCMFLCVCACKHARVCVHVITPCMSVFSIVRLKLSSGEIPFFIEEKNGPINYLASCILYMYFYGMCVRVYSCIAVDSNNIVYGNST